MLWASDASKKPYAYLIAALLVIHHLNQLRKIRRKVNKKVPLLKWRKSTKGAPKRRPNTCKTAMTNSSTSCVRPMKSTLTCASRTINWKTRSILWSYRSSSSSQRSNWIMQRRAGKEYCQAQEAPTPIALQVLLGRGRPESLVPCLSSHSRPRSRQLS